MQTCRDTPTFAKLFKYTLAQASKTEVCINSNTQTKIIKGQLHNFILEVWLNEMHFT